MHVDPNRRHRRAAENTALALAHTDSGRRIGHWQIGHASANFKYTLFGSDYVCVCAREMALLDCLSEAEREDLRTARTKINTALRGRVARAAAAGRQAGRQRLQRPLLPDCSAVFMLIENVHKAADADADP